MRVDNPPAHPYDSAGRLRDGRSGRRTEKDALESLRELYRIGNGPSSRHTIGPKQAAEWFLARHPSVAAFRGGNGDLHDFCQLRNFAYVRFAHNGAITHLRGIPVFCRRRVIQ